MLPATAQPLSELPGRTDPAPHFWECILQVYTGTHEKGGGPGYRNCLLVRAKTYQPSHLLSKEDSGQWYRHVMTSVEQGD